MAKLKYNIIESCISKSWPDNTGWAAGAHIIDQDKHISCMVYENHIKTKKQAKVTAQKMEQQLLNKLLGGVEGCRYCGGNGTDMPCAYPGERKKGCIVKQYQDDKELRK